MVSQITLGNINTQGGKTIVSGSQSGIDTEALIKGLTEAKRLPAVRLETKNKTLATEKTALGSLQSLLTRFRTAVDALRNPPGVLNASQNIFEYRTATMSSIVSASNYLNVTVEPGTNVQDVTIDEITQLARGTKQQTNTFTLASADADFVLANGDATAGQMSAGTFQLRVLDGGANASITLAEDDSLNEVAAKFNAVKDRTGIQATVVKIANGTPNSQFKISFSSTQTGTTYGFDLENAGTVISDPDGVLTEVTSHVDFTTPQTAQNATFSINNVTVTRESNVIDDLIDGMTFTLKQELSDTTPITVAIEPDLEIVTNALNTFADVYNELRVFQAKQSERGEDGLPTEEAVLANSAALRQVVNAVASEITSVVNGLTDGDPAALTDLGINFQDFEGDEETPKTRNIIVIDAQKLQSALEANFDKVRNVFEFRTTSDNDNIAVFKRSNSLAVNEFTLTIDRTNNVYTATYAGGSAQFDYVAGVGDAITLKGRAGTVFEGLELVYVSTEDTTVNFSMTQGIGDRLFNALDSSLGTGGTITNALQTIEDQTGRNTTEITKIDEFIERYREQLINQYAALEAALTKANNLLNLLTAQSDARANQ